MSDIPNYPLAYSPEEITRLEEQAHQLTNHSPQFCLKSYWRFMLNSKEGFYLEFPSAMASIRQGPYRSFQSPNKYAAKPQIGL